MGEIRSTMDIIMEKARGLTLSDEEKRQFREQEMEGKIRGLIQRYMDGLLDLERLKIEIESLRGRDMDMADRLMRVEIMGRIEPGADNSGALIMLAEILGLDTGPIRKMLAEHETELKKETTGRKMKILERFSARGISGSAVLPNPAADPAWQAFMTQHIDSFRESLAQLVQEASPAAE